VKDQQHDANSVSSTSKMWSSAFTWFAKFNLVAGPLRSLQDSRKDLEDLIQNQVQWARRRPATVHPLWKSSGRRIIMVSSLSGRMRICATDSSSNRMMSQEHIRRRSMLLFVFSNNLGRSMTCNEKQARTINLPDIY
jgi:hypothetical protein